MKRLEQRESLGRIFYTIIQANSSSLSLNSLSINFGKTLVISIIQIDSIKTLLPVYNVGVMVDWNIVGEASITVNKWSSRYEINRFRMEGGLKRIREVMELIKAH